MAEKSRELDEGIIEDKRAKYPDGMMQDLRYTDARKPKANPLTVKIDVDVSEALTGLKAVERQAKKATQAIRELETYYERDDKQYYVKWRQQGDDCTDIREVCMTDIPTVYLQRELAKRQPDLSELLAGITADNRHEVVDFIQRSYD